MIERGAFDCHIQPSDPQPTTQSERMLVADFRKKGPFCRHGQFRLYSY